MAFRSNIVSLIETLGSSEERQLIARWRREIDGFVGAFGPDLLTGKYLLAFELSNDLDLSLTVRPAITPCPTLALRARRWLQEPIRTAADLAAAANVDCQITLNVSATACRHTLHLDNQAASGFPLQSHYGYSHPAFSPAVIHSWLLSNEISFWLSSKQVPQLERRLKEATTHLETRFRVSLEMLPAEMLEQYTWNNGQGWSLTRSGLALHNVPAELAARLLSASDVKYFRYLAPYRSYRLLAVTFGRSEQIEKYILLP